MKTKIPQSREEKMLELEARLQEAEDTLEAIRHGAVDALVVKSRESQEIFTLRSADHTYRVLIESMNQGALTMNFDGVILYSNKRFSTMIGQPLEKVIGNDILSFVAADDHQAVTTLLNGKRSIDTSLEISLQSTSGSTLTVIASVTLVKQPDVKPYLCVVITDMTERKQAEDAKDEFISIASHQLRTPATSVKQYINMILDGLFGELSSPLRDALERANKSNERELRIVEDLLKVAQIDAGKIILNRSSIDVGNLVGDVIREHSAGRVIARTQHISYLQPKAAVIAYADEGLTRMVIENLLDNASKYMDEEGTITIKLAARGADAIMTIRDQGVGMSEQDVAKLFQKFTRLPNSLSIKVGGNGLGLYWVKKVLDLHEATIAVESAVGKGTTFTINLPREDPNA